MASEADSDDEVVTYATFPAAAVVIAEQFPAVLARMIAIYAIQMSQHFLIQELLIEGVVNFTSAECLDLGITAVDVRCEDNWALCEACTRGHLAVAKWLVTAFGLTAADALAARGLARAFGLAARDALAARGLALRKEHLGGHRAIVQWMDQTFGPTTVAE